MKKGQQAIEFLILLTIVLIITTGIGVVMQQTLEDEQARKNEQIMLQYLNVMETEVRMADISSEDYRRSFYIPDAIEGYEVNATFGEDPQNVSDELVIQYAGTQYVYFLPQPVNYTAVSTIGGVHTVQKDCSGTTCRIWFS